MASIPRFEYRYAEQKLRTRKMKITKDSLSWAIIALLVGTLFGSGSIWQWQKNNLDRERFELEKITKSMEIRKRVDDLLADIIEISNEYIKVSNSYYSSKNPSDGNEMKRLITRLDVLKNDFKTIEKSLSLVEGREPREIQIDFIPPAPPTNLRVIIQ
ncbi:MAG: hypothetical protein A2521_08865 [Deltaproteobacteria bacterium RIFOXYD12_FULL_57_12]|nr:MAG: hypothetical protein A2521_08865 [Deltaproteobacteria bacterium RIFOXYD12_FULL_57_12]